MAQSERVSWHGSDPFYDHLKTLWDFEANRRLALTSSDDPVIIARLLEDWYESVDTMYCRIVFFIKEEEREKLNKIIENITELTKGNQFVSASLSSEELTKLRLTIRNFSRYVFILMGQYRMLLPTAVSNDPHKALQNG